MKVVCVLQKTYGNLSSSLIKKGPSRRHYAFLVWWTLASHEKKGGMVPTRVSGHVFTKSKASARNAHPKETVFIFRIAFPRKPKALAIA